MKSQCSTPYLRTAKPCSDGPARRATVPLVPTPVHVEFAERKEQPGGSHMLFVLVASEYATIIDQSFWQPHLLA